ncbi:MAG: hypothetical protein QOK04_2078 [Solirubrobacteraceae bacterium]|nr:hypothetical protein [Solirubrobacteraceae bacterium]
MDLIFIIVAGWVLAALAFGLLARAIARVGAQADAAVEATAIAAATRSERGGTTTEPAA